MNRSLGAALLCRAYALLLFAYPREFRARFGAEMRQSFRDRWLAVSVDGDVMPRLKFLLAILKDWLCSFVTERISAMKLNIRNKGWRRAVRSATVALGGVVVCACAGAPFLQGYVISSASMENSLKIGDYLLINKIGAAHELNRGDMVTFHYPLDRNQVFVKRVIGLPGDRIRLSDKQVIRNGQPVAEPYVEHRTSYIDTFRDNFPSDPPSFLPKSGREMLANNLVNGEVVVPPDALFVLGDNRDDSLDSRYWGFVQRSQVIGRPLIVYWSYQPAPGEARPGALPKHILSKTRWDRVFTIPK